MANGPQVLDENDLNRIQNALQQSERAEQIIELAQQAGLDVEQQKERNKRARDQLLRIKNTFFPGR